MVILIYGMSTTKKSDNVKTIVLQPYIGFPKTYVEYVKNNLLLIVELHNHFKNGSN